MKSITIALFLVLTNQAVVAETLSGRVVAVADGDTVTVLDAERQQQHRCSQNQGNEINST